MAYCSKSLYQWSCHKQKDPNSSTDQCSHWEKYWSTLIFFIRSQNFSPYYDSLNWEILQNHIVRDKDLSSETMLQRSLFRLIRLLESLFERLWFNVCLMILIRASISWDAFDSNTKAPALRSWAIILFLFSQAALSQAWIFACCSNELFFKDYTILCMYALDCLHVQHSTSTSLTSWLRSWG